VETNATVFLPPASPPALLEQPLRESEATATATTAVATIRIFLVTVVLLFLVELRRQKRR
jgi:hypothetical protein